MCVCFGEVGAPLDSSPESFFFLTQARAQWWYLHLRGSGASLSSLECRTRRASTPLDADEDGLRWIVRV